MKKFYRNALVVALLAIAGFLACEALVRRLEQPYFAKQRLEWLRHERLSPKVALVGSSTVHYGLGPRIVAKVSGDAPGKIVNISGNAFTPLINEHIWRRYEDELSGVKLVLYGIDPWIFYQFYYRTNDFMRLQWSARQRIAYTRYAYRIGLPDTGTLTGLYARRVLKTIYEQRRRTPQPPVFTPLQGSGILRRPAQDVSNAHARNEFGNTSAFPISALNLERLARLKRRVEEQGAMFVLLFPPKSPAWLKSYVRSCDDIDAELAAALQSKVGPIRTLGSFRLFADRPDFFVDHVHLNEAGRREFSEFVGRSLSSLADQTPRELTSLIDVSQL